MPARTLSNVTISPLFLLIPQIDLSFLMSKPKQQFTHTQTSSGVHVPNKKCPLPSPPCPPAPMPLHAQRNLILSRPLGMSESTNKIPFVSRPTYLQSTNNRAGSTKLQQTHQKQLMYHGVRPRARAAGFLPPRLCFAGIRRQDGKCEKRGC